VNRAHLKVGGTYKKVISFPVFLGFLLVAAGFAGRRLNLEEVCRSSAGSIPEFFFQGDTWVHIKIGSDILRLGAWPTSDSYSFTAEGRPWVAYEWLGGVALALAARLGGLPALMALLVVLAATILVLLYYYAYLRSGSSIAAFVACVLLLPLASLSFAIRPQLFGYIFLLLTLICVELFNQGRQKFIWLLPGLFAIWVNTHATVFWGLFALILPYLGSSRTFRSGGIEAYRWSAGVRRRLVIVLLLCVAALTVSPYGIRLILHIVRLGISQPIVMSNFAEWLAIDFSQMPGKLLLGFLLLFMLDLIVFRPTYRLEEIALLFVAIYVACVHGRFILLFVPVFAPVLATRLSRFIPPYESSKDRYLLNALLVVLISAGIVRFFPSKALLHAAMARAFPLGAMAYVQHNPVGPMWNDPGWGGYMVWALPTHKVFIDGRLDFYEQAGVLPDFVHVARLEPDTLSILRKYGVRSCLTERGSQLSTLLGVRPEWQLAYTDELSSVYTYQRTDPQKGPKKKSSRSMDDSWRWREHSGFAEPR